MTAESDASAAGDATTAGAVSAPSAAGGFGRPGSGQGTHVANLDRRRALAAHHDRLHVVVAGGVVQHERRSFRTGEPAVAPRGHRRQDRVGVSTLVGESILVAWRVGLILDPAKATLVDEGVEALS